MKISRLLGGCALLLVVGFTARARAQTPESAEAPTVGDQGHWSLSLERAFGLDYVRATASPAGGTETTSSFTTLSLFGNPPVAALAGFTFPRLAFDASVAPGFTVGAALGLGYGTETQSGASTSFVSVVAAPRVGYVARLSPSIAVWPRVGVSVFYASITPATGGSESLSLFAATIDAPFIITVAPRVAVTFGPTLDVTFSGSAKADLGAYGAGSADAHLLEIGAQAGLVVTL
ncbi:MAG TPA: hypothetical protein VKZ18_04160 [Polyangia bacterium]|nr:hypothetical protein [Polyangia bacterium]